MGFICSAYGCTHRADGNGDARLVHRANAFVVGGFNDRHLFLFFREACNGHGAADAGVARHYRLPGNWLTALWIQGERCESEKDTSQLFPEIIHSQTEKEIYSPTLIYMYIYNSAELASNESIYQCLSIKSNCTLIINAVRFEQCKHKFYLPLHFVAIHFQLCSTTDWLCLLLMGVHIWYLVNPTLHMTVNKSTS